MRVTALALVFVSVCSISTFCAGAADLRSISTSGEATVYVPPDEAAISFGIETADQNLDKAKQDNDTGSTKLVAALKAAGIPEKEIQTDVVSVELRYRNGHEHIIESYIVRRMYSVTLKDVKLFESVVDAGLKNGANRLVGLEFRTTALRKHRDQARKLAIVAAKEKAQALAAELDCKVGKPRTISEGYSGGYGSRSWWGYGGNFSNASQNVAQAGGGGEEGGNTPLGEIAVKAQISVTFDLE